MNRHPVFKDIPGKVLLFPGALGTELQRRGYNTALPLWSAQANLDAVDLVTEIHADYLSAGAQVCVTNTFRTTPRTFRKVGREDEARDALKCAVAAAHTAKARAGGPETLIAGSFAPLEDCYSPHLVPEQTMLEHEHGEQAQWLADEGVDFLLPETINARAEAKVMANAAQQTGLPFIISFVVDANARLLDGTVLEDAIKATDLPGRAGIMLNCRPIDVIDSVMPGLAKVSQGTAFGAYPNGIGHAHDEQGWIFMENADSVGRFVEASLRWKDLGATILGGCCGTTPAYLRALAQTLHNA